MHRNIRCQNLGHLSMTAPENQDVNFFAPTNHDVLDRLPLGDSGVENKLWVIKQVEGGSYRKILGVM